MIIEKVQKMKKFLTLALTLFMLITFFTVTPVNSLAKEKSHTIVIKGKINATCKKKGYTGDKYCKVCKKVISKGKKTPKKHNIVIKKARKSTCKKYGYTGDKYCKVCKKVISKGKKIAKQHSLILRNAVKPTVTKKGYTGDTYCRYCNKIMSKGQKITKVDGVPDYKSVTSVEKSVFNEMNVNRKKAGVRALKWDSELYPAAKIRSNEFVYWYEVSDQSYYPHNRPTGESFATVRFEIGINNPFYSTCGENLAINTDKTEICSGWMSSKTGHREAILNKEYTYVSVAVVKKGNLYYSCAFFHDDKMY